MYQYHNYAGSPGSDDALDASNPATLVHDLASDDDPVRKMAAFRLQTAIGDPSFCDRFLQEDGLPVLHKLALNSSGNTLAYTLASLYNILDLDQGWEKVDDALVKRLVQLIVAQPLVNILRGAMSILVVIVAKQPSEDLPEHYLYGFRALKPALEVYPDFLDKLVDRLSSADHALCGNALELINLMMRNAITKESELEWAKFIAQMHQLGIIKSVYELMHANGLQDMAGALLEFQALTKLLLKKWKQIPVDMDNREHRVALKALHLAGEAAKVEYDRTNHPNERGGKGKQIPYEWRRLGFDTESPMYEFDNVGYLGMMDMTDFVRKSQDGFQKLLLEQAAKPMEQRCPIAKASIALTTILYDHFEIEECDADGQQFKLEAHSRSAGGLEKMFTPLLMQWSRLHTCGLQAFLRLWSATGAERDEFSEIEELVRILVEQLLDSAPRTKSIAEVEDEFAAYELSKLRQLQMDLLELTHEDAWGHHLRQVRNELQLEALQFIKEQRIRCLLQGSWFPSPSSADGSPNAARTSTRANPGLSSSWRFVRLSPNRRYLHYDDFASKPADEMPVSVVNLDNKIDLSIISSVISNVSAPAPTDPSNEDSNYPVANTNTEITIRGYVSPSDPAYAAASAAGAGVADIDNDEDDAVDGVVSDFRRIIRDGSGAGPSSSVQPYDPDAEEISLLTLYPQSHTSASEWLDGLLLLLNQQPITAETNKLVDFIAKYGLQIRLLNVRYEEVLSGVGRTAATNGTDGGKRHKGVYGGEEVILPDRRGVDDEFYYDIAGM